MTMDNLEDGRGPSWGKPGSWEPHVDGLAEEEPIVSTMHPRFHIDLSAAVEAAVGGEW